MNLVVVSGRYASPKNTLREDSEFVSGLARAGCDVRWVVPTPPVEDVPVADGARVIPASTTAPGFAKVQGRLLDGATEREVTVTIRAELPDVAHFLDYGGCTSANVNWAAARMGASTVISIRSAKVLCHRGDLIHGDGSLCGTWDDARRCAACCLTPSERGIGGFGSVVGRFLGAIRWPVNPYPTAVDFLNRTELLLGGLQVADSVVVRSAAEKEQITSVGLRTELIDVLTEPSVGDWLAHYRRVAERARG